MRMDRMSHIGEYDAKTNAICLYLQNGAAVRTGPKKGPFGDANGCAGAYCPWVTRT
jgi:hypothetical protein